MNSFWFLPPLPPWLWITIGTLFIALIGWLFLSGPSTGAQDNKQDLFADSSILSSFILLALSVAAFWFFTDYPGIGRYIALVALIAAGMAVYDILTPSKGDQVIVVLGPFKWKLRDFIRGWSIVGETGSMKTSTGIVNILLQVLNRLPDTGGMAIDYKSDFADDVLLPLFKVVSEKTKIDATGKLKTLRVRSSAHAAEPLMRFNYLAENIHHATAAKMIVDVATAVGQSGGQSHFRIKAMNNLASAFDLLKTVNLPVTITRAREILLNEDAMRKTLDLLKNLNIPNQQKEALYNQFKDNYLDMKSPEELSGIIGTIDNYTFPFRIKEIAEVFSSDLPNTVSLTDMDKGAWIVTTMPQTFKVERRYINTLMSELYNYHTAQRFEIPKKQRRKLNLLIKVQDEAQELTTASEDKTGDWQHAGVIRDAKATIIQATQDVQSYYPFIGKECTNTLLYNLCNKLVYKSASKEGSEKLANDLGEYMGQEKSISTNPGGQTSYSVRKVPKPYYHPHELRNLPPGVCIIKHVGKTVPRKVALQPNDAITQAM